MDLSSLLDLNNLARESGFKVSRKRFAFDNLFGDDGQHFVGIVGARGTGKTTMLKQFLSLRDDSFYISMDTFEGDLFECAKYLSDQMGIRYLLLDEVHFYRSFDAYLKKIYDFLDIKIYFTGSVALALVESSYDLSRRVILKTLYPFSFREYLWFKYDREIASLDMNSLLDGNIDRCYIELYPYLKEYLTGGIMPFALNEVKTIEIIKNILETIVNRDIAVYANLAVDELNILSKMIAFIGVSGIDGINYTSLSNNLKITKYKAVRYVEILQKAFVLNVVMPAGTNVMKEPKILMSVPYRLLFSDYERSIGGLREDFFVESMSMAGKPVQYLKSVRGAKTPDYILSDHGSDIVFEIGGKGKGREQFKGIKVEKKIIFADSIENKGTKRPLFLAGCL